MNIVEQIETSILRGLLYSEEYSRKVYPYLQSDFFDSTTKTIFNFYRDLFDKYNKMPNVEAMVVSMQKSKLQEGEYEQVISALETVVSSCNDAIDVDWLIDETESYCKSRALYNAIYKSVDIIEGNDKKLDINALPDIINDALGVGFTTTIGSDYLDDIESRYTRYLSKEDKLEFPIDALNILSNGGLPKKTLNVILAGCVHPDTKITFKVDLSNGHMSNPITAHVSVVKDLLVDYVVYVTSPDGYVPVKEYVDKGKWIAYNVHTSKCDIQVNENHLFETNNGWMFAKDIVGREDLLVLSNNDVYIPITVTKTADIIPIVDLVIDHPNHRYYTDGISSHNTNVGKSALMAWLAGEWLKKNKSVLYISMEMSEEAVQERIDANLLNLTTDELHNADKLGTLEEFKKKIKNIALRTTGKLIVKEFPTSGAHAGHFRLLLKELKQKKKFVPDIIFIDYINICASSRYKSMSGVNSYSYIKAIAEELRGLAVEFAVPVVSATQTNREGYGDGSPDMTSVSDSFGLSMTVDWMIAAVTNEELAKMNNMLLLLLKTRYGNKAKATTQAIKCDYDHMRFTDVTMETKEAFEKPIQKRPSKQPDVVGTHKINWE